MQGRKSQKVFEQKSGADLKFSQFFFQKNEGTIMFMNFFLWRFTRKLL